MKQLVAVTIPVYKETPTGAEVLSLAQCLKILHRYPVIFFAPHSLNTSFYENYSSGKAAFRIERFDDEYFLDIGGYNKLMLSPGFYKRFFGYRYILVYQLDAYVFKDDLFYWCSQGYDFIGAPHEPRNNLPGEMHFLKSYDTLLRSIKKYSGIDHKISNVGNGGFSLRKVSSCYRLLKILRSKTQQSDKLNEDSFFEYWGNLFYPFFKLPPDEKALQFSIETSPAESLKKLNGKLPFGCHAFEKYSFETWKPFIKPGA